jgi:hypothetical protein
MNFAPAYAQGVKVALAELRLTNVKSAGLFNVLNRTGARIGAQIGSRIINPPAKYLTGLGARAENAVYPQTAKFLSPENQSRFKTLTQNVAGHTLNEMAGGAAIGGLAGAGTNAAMAEPGERGEAAARGALHGAWTGALWGAVSGPTRHLIRNATRGHLTNLGAKIDPTTAAAAAHQVVDKDRWRQNVKDVFTGKGPLGRRGAATAALSGTVGAGLADFYLPTKVLNAVEGENPHTESFQDPAQPRVVTASSKKEDEGMSTGIKGSTIGGMATNIAVRGLRYKGKLPFQKKLHPFLLEITPMLLTSAGGAAGYLTAKKIEKHFKAAKHPKK